MKTVAVFFGGRSTEHDVSIITGLASVIKPLEQSGNYRVEAVYIGRDGRWYWDDRLKEIKLYQGPGLEDFLRKAPTVQVQFDGGLTLTKTGGLTGRKIARQIDIAFPAMHGTYGEDGTLMGVLRMGNIPFVGCDLEASAIAMNKLLTHSVCAAAGIDSHRYIGIDKVDFEQHPQVVIGNIEKHFGLSKSNDERRATSDFPPLFVKPTRLGSSIGISRITKKEELVNALEVALHYDTLAIVEEAVPNLVEVTVPIMGNVTPIPAMPEEPALSSEDFFDFETKYMKGGKGGKKGEGKSGGEDGAQGYSHIPARLPAVMLKKCSDTAIAVYKAIGASGMARVDLLVDAKAERVYVNEVNPLPGSLYAHNWKKCGISAVELVEKFIAYAEEYHRAKQAQTTVFQTNYLRQF